MATVFKTQQTVAFALILTTMAIVGTALAMEFLAEELAKVYVVPLLVSTFFVLTPTAVILIKTRSWTSS